MKYVQSEDNEKMTVRLKQVIKFLKTNDRTLTNYWICKQLGYKSLNYISDLIGGNKPINHIFLEKLRITYYINTEYILKGEGEMFTVKEINFPKPKNNISQMTGYEGFSLCANIIKETLEKLNSSLENINHYFLKTINDKEQ